MSWQILNYNTFLCAIVGVNILSVLPAWVLECVSSWMCHCCCYSKPCCSMILCPTVYMKPFTQRFPLTQTTSTVSGITATHLSDLSCHLYVSELTVGLYHQLVKAVVFKLTLWHTIPLCSAESKRAVLAPMPPAPPLLHYLSRSVCPCRSCWCSLRYAASGWL